MRNSASLNKNSIQKLKNVMHTWWCVAWKTWTALVIGTSFIPLFLIMDWDLERSGAILVASCLVGELLLFNEKWLGYSNELPLGLATKNANVFIVGQIQLCEKGSTQLAKLRATAFATDITENEKWTFKQTTHRTLLIVSTVIVFLAVTGTIIWGFGDKL